LVSIFLISFFLNTSLEDATKKYKYNLLPWHEQEENTPEESLNNGKKKRTEEK